MPGAVAIVALNLASPPVTVITIPIDEPTTTSQVSTTTATTPATTTATTPTTTATTTATTPTTTATSPTTTGSSTAITVEGAVDDAAVYLVAGVVLVAVVLVAVILLRRRRARRRRQAAAAAVGRRLTERVRELSEQAMMESAPDRLDEAAIAELYPWISTDEGIVIDLSDDDALASPDRNHDSRDRNGSS